MKVFDIYLEVSSHVLEFNRDDAFQYKEIKRIQQTSDGRIEFSLLLDVKQSDLAPDKYIDVELIHILETSSNHGVSQDGEEKQRIRLFDLGQIELFNLDFKQKRTSDLLQGDPWSVKQLIKWNCTNVPADGLGSYAIVSSVPSIEVPGKKDILDCCYFEVI